MRLKWGSFEPEPDGHKYAIDLLKQVTDLNAGIWRMI
jgi:methylenetetrahydrofolate reductase (NADPH)